jgi:hypothetical protein
MTLTRDFLNIFNHFAKLYDRLKFWQIWQPTVVRHTATTARHNGFQRNRRGPQRQEGEPGPR